MPRGTLRLCQHRPDALLASGARIRRTVEAGNLLQDDRVLRKHPGRRGRDALNMANVEIQHQGSGAAQGCATAFALGTWIMAAMAFAIGHNRLRHGFRDELVALP